MAEEINHPHRYNQGGIECIDAMKASTINKVGIEAICVSNVLKYLWRYEEKNGSEDIKKAQWYLNRLLKEVEEREQNTYQQDCCDGCCDDCKYMCLLDDDANWDSTESMIVEPCKSCKYNFVYGSDEYNKAPNNFARAE